MPHCIIDCSEQIAEKKSPVDIIQSVYDVAYSAKLFLLKEIKVRINPFQYYNTGNTSGNLIQAFANIKEGRNTVQKANLSRQL